MTERMTTTWRIASALVFTGLALATVAQETDEPGPQTEMESFLAQHGAVVIRGFTRVGGLAGQNGTGVSVKAWELINAATGTKRKGIEIEVYDSSSRTRERSSFVDYKEIDSLLAGLDYMAGVDKSSTILEDFEAAYRTQGNLEFATFDAERARMLGVASGRGTGVRALFPASSLKQIRDLLAAAKIELDRGVAPSNWTCPRSLVFGVFGGVKLTAEFEVDVPELPKAASKKLRRKVYKLLRRQRWPVRWERGALSFRKAFRRIFPKSSRMRFKR